MLPQPFAQEPPSYYVEKPRNPDKDSLSAGLWQEDIKYQARPDARMLEGNLGCSVLVFLPLPKIGNEGQPRSPAPVLS